MLLHVKLKVSLIAVPCSRVYCSKRIQSFVLSHQVLINLLISAAKVVAIGSVCRGAWQLHLVSRAIRADTVAFLAANIKYI